jgi:hypothetical protein
MSVRRRPLLLAAFVLLLGAVAACRQEPKRQAQPVPPGAPKLVLLIVIDQMRADYLERFAPLFDGGLARLLAESVSFTDNHQAHARTETAAGHATLATGLFPAHHGIVGNQWWSRELEDWVYAAEDPEHGRSPVLLLRPTLGDRMKAAWPEAKVFAIGGKDRSAIMSAGKDADGAYWYSDAGGQFTTSSYWPEAAAEDDDPATNWVEAFHQRRLLDPLFGTVWTPLRPLQELSRFGVAATDYGVFSAANTFPHALGGPSLVRDEAFYDGIYGSPFVDGYVVDFAKALIDAESLGLDETPDFLAVTLSALDSVGHEYGPDSPEVADTLERLDDSVGDLLELIDQRIGLEQVIVVLSSDHGVGRVPEIVAAEGGSGGRFGAAEVACIQDQGRRVTERFGLGDENWMPERFYLDLEILAQRQVDPNQLLAELAAGLATCPRIERVLLRSDLAQPADRMAELHARSFHPERSGDLFAHLAPDTLTSSTTASHGQPHRYDTQVPWLLRVPGATPRRIAEPTATVDVVPTIARHLGIETPDVDGVDRGALYLDVALSATP